MSATTRQRKKSIHRRFVIPVAASAVLAYFAFHAVNGEFGTAGRERIEQDKLAMIEQYPQFAPTTWGLKDERSLIMPDDDNDERDDSEDATDE